MKSLPMFETKSFYHPYRPRKRYFEFLTPYNNEYITPYIDYQYDQNGHCTMIDYLNDIPKGS